MNYEDILKNHLLKVTPQRVGILTIMHNMGHIDIEELFTYIKKEFPSISLATLYKNINAMLEKNLIHEIKVPNFKAKYEIAKEPHIHLLCKECNEFIDLDVNIGSVVSEASQKSHYKLEDSCVVLSGVCEKCQ